MDRELYGHTSTDKLNRRVGIVVIVVYSAWVLLLMGPAMTEGGLPGVVLVLFTLPWSIPLSMLVSSLGLNVPGLGLVLFPLCVFLNSLIVYRLAFQRSSKVS